MVPATDEPNFRALEQKTEVNSIADWLKHGPMKNDEIRKGVCDQNAIIEESEVIFAIYRAIAKFDAVFSDQKTPQMISFRICAAERLRTRQ
jgi:hypothetical protein